MGNEKENIYRLAHAETNQVENWQKLVFGISTHYADSKKIRYFFMVATTFRKNEIFRILTRTENLMMRRIFWHLCHFCSPGSRDMASQI
jgi:hypothetical protein